MYLPLISVIRMLHIAQMQVIHPSPVFGPDTSAGTFSYTPLGIVIAHVNTGEIDMPYIP